MVRCVLLLGVVVAVCGCGRARYQDGGDGGIDAAASDAPTPSSDAGSDASVSLDAFLSTDVAVALDAHEPLDVPAAVDSPPPDAFDPPDVAMPDAFVESDALEGPDAARDPACDAVLVDPSTASDAVVFDCAVRGQLGRCRISATFGCGGGCACNYYVQNTGWDCPASCPTDLTRTGCIEFVGGGLLYPPAPVACGAATTAEQLGACTMRHEILAGHCGACMCPS